MSKDVTPDRVQAGMDSEHARIVKEVLEDQARRRAVREAADAARAEDVDTSFFVQVGFLVTATLFFYLLFFSPAWIAPTAPDPVPAAQVEDGLRFAIYMTAEQVESFRDSEGRLPASMEELPGGERPGVVYERLDAETFSLRATTGETSLRYVSSQPLAEFLGGAARRALLGGGTS